MSDRQTGMTANFEALYGKVERAAARAGDLPRTADEAGEPHSARWMYLPKTEDSNVRS